MSDWLSKLEEQRKKAAAQSKAQAEREQQVLHAYYNKMQSSYEQNKDRVEGIYSAIEKYIKRTSDMGFKVEAFRPVKGWMFIKGSYTSWDGEGKTSVTLELRPWGNGFLIHYNDSCSHRKETSISFYRVNDRVIADWVKWAVGEGPDNPIEERQFKIILLAIALGFVLLILIVLINSKF